MKFLVRFFDKLEDRIRGRLSHYPIIYAVIGGIGVVLFWRGVWVTADYFIAMLEPEGLVEMASSINSQSIQWWDGPLSFIVGSVIMLITGVFVSNFIGNEIIITGLRGDKKISEKTEREVRHEVGAIGEMRADIKRILAESHTSKKAR